MARRKLYSEDHYSDEVKKQLAELRAKRQAKFEKHQIAKAEKQLGKQFSEAQKETFVKRLRDTSKSSKSRYSSYKATNTVKYANARGKTETFNGHTVTSYADRFVDLSGVVFRLSYELAPYRNVHPDMRTLLGELEDILNLATDEYEDYDVVKNETIRDIGEVKSLIEAIKMDLDNTIAQAADGEDTTDERALFNKLEELSSAVDDLSDFERTYIRNAAG